MLAFLVRFLYIKRKGYSMSQNFHNLKTLAKLTSVSTAIISVSNQFIIYQSSLTNKLARTPNKKYYKSKLSDLFYTVNGSGTPILLIHDMNPGGSGYEWKKIEKELAKNHTVYNIDLPGCGRSEKKNMIYTNFFFTSLINQFIKDVIKEKIDIIASGYSSFIPLTLAFNNETLKLNKQFGSSAHDTSSNPEEPLINKIVLVNPCDLNKYSRIPSSKEKIFYNILNVPVYGTLIYHMVVSHENIDYQFIENYYFNPFHPDTDLEESYYEAAHKGRSYSKYLYSSLVRNYTGCNMDKFVKNVKIPVSIIMGEAEFHCEKIIQQYQNLNPNISISTIPKSKHFPHVENMEIFLEKLSI